MRKKRGKKKKQQNPKENNLCLKPSPSTHLLFTSTFWCARLRWGALGPGGPGSALAGTELLPAAAHIWISVVMVAALR